MKNWKPTRPPFSENKNKVFADAAKVSDFIYQIGESELLRQPSKEVSLATLASDELQAKISYLKECLQKYRDLTGRGRGISAVQVGIPERFSAVYTSEGIIILINPVITGRSERQYKYPEICMSANPIIAPVIRPAWIAFDYYDERGEKYHWETKDDTEQGRILNRVFQHEIDHLDGIINVDIVSSPHDLILDSDPTFYDRVTFEEV
jgi:peptide deformylase